MSFEQVRQVVDGIPHMTAERGGQIFQFVRRVQPRAVLELGFAHGVSSCYIGAALRENGAGSLTTIDLASARLRRPDIRDLLERTNLSEWVNPIFTASSYTWELMRILERLPPDDGLRFDFAFIDGAHTWETDGFAFFLVDRLLEPGGWILFDDLDWTFGTSPTLGATDEVQHMPPDERDTPQIGKVFDLLVRPHPSYSEFEVDGSWGWARKAGP